MIFVFKTFVILAVNTIDYFIVKQQVTLLNFFWIYLIGFIYCNLITKVHSWFWWVKLTYLLTQTVSLLGETSTTMLIWNSNRNKVMCICVEDWNFAGLERTHLFYPLYNCRIGLVSRISRSFILFFFSNLGTIQIDLNTTSQIIVSCWQIAQRLLSEILQSSLCTLLVTPDPLPLFPL